MNYTHKNIEGNVNVSSPTLRRELFVLLGITVAGVVVIYIALGLTVDLLVAWMPEGFEDRMSVLSPVVFDDKTEHGKARGYLQGHVDNLAREAFPDKKTPYRVHIIDDAKPNAMALNGRLILVSTTLLKELRSQNELTFVLAHELGHYAHRDHLRAMGRSLAIMVLTATIFGDNSTISSFIVNSLSAMETRYSRGQETRADLFALELLYKHYGHVAGASDFFERLSKQDSTGPYAYLLASHPYPLHRIKTLNDHIKQMNYPVKKLTPVSEELKLR
ncbi:MAG: M48 family metallopeptidase [Candidatus Magnetobacterium sp. LHC-1]|uniref:M48 family metallopeptidase n=1 Tax=Candidatus Magnetobacterium casense TaxID=1455061 RepID=A0ABS6S1F6_9BACT|nr:M48 family metallopeptidase [Candidatus Magnetobacterium casensis]MBF0607994.1 M48 family metallopeptidase [Nitrospirota bacterium]MBV6342233.1 M48 family metallopeptidase [Candidatus Magnetobacterium casensis]